jgi:glycerol-3-phosphate cytidylyltransferase
VIPENSWEQKIEDIKKYDVDVFAIGEDWQGKFDFLQEYCEVQYLPRTEDISSSLVREVLKGINSTQIEQIRAALDILQRVVKDLS